MKTVTLDSTIREVLASMNDGGVRACHVVFSDKQTNDPLLVLTMAALPDPVANQFIVDAFKESVRHVDAQVESLH